MSQKRLKVLFVSQLYGSQIHGPSRKLTLLAKVLKDPLSTLDLRILTEDAINISEHDYLKTYTPKPRPLQFLSKYWRSKAYFEYAEEIYQSWKFDILVFNDAGKAYYTAVSRERTYKVVAMLNDTNSVDMQKRSYEPFRKYIVRRLLARLEATVARKADLVICPSSFLAGKAAEAYHLNTTPSVLHPAIDKSEWENIQPPSISEKKTILFVKSDPHRGGLHLLLEALSHESIEKYFSKLIIGGLDEAEQQIFSEMALSIPIQLDWRGKLSRKQFKQAVSESHIGIVPSLHEAFSITTSEFAAGGLVVVASDAEGIPEGARSFAIFFESGNTISLRHKLIAAAKTPSLGVTIHYGHVEMADEFQKLLHNIV